MEVNKSIFKRQADFLEKNGKYILQFTLLALCKLKFEKNVVKCYNSTGGIYELN